MHIDLFYNLCFSTLFMKKRLRFRGLMTDSSFTLLYKNPIGSGDDAEGIKNLKNTLQVEHFKKVIPVVLSRYHQFFYGFKLSSLVAAL